LGIKKSLFILTSAINPQLVSEIFDKLLLEKIMHKKSLRSLAVGLATAFASLMALTTLELTSITPAAEAACRPTGRFVGGLPILKCSGASKCRPTGRFKQVNGRRYRLLRC
jgi:hypothetical protein